MKIFSIIFHVMLTLVTTMLAIIDISYMYIICGLNLKLGHSLSSHKICIFKRLYATTRHVLFMLYPEVHSINFFRNVSKTQFYREKARNFIEFTYGKNALRHTAYVTGRAMACQEFRHFTVSKSNFNRKINKHLVRIFQQGWYC